MNGDYVWVFDDDWNVIANVEYAGRWCGVVYCEYCGDCMYCSWESPCYGTYEGRHQPYIKIADYEQYMLGD